MPHQAGAPVFRGRAVRCLAATALALLVTSAAGCGSGPPAPATAPVSGVVTVDGAPVEHAQVSFVPIEGTPGLGSAATTDAGGRYGLRTPWRRSGLMGQGVTWLEGMPPGRYRVVVSRRLHADGSPMRADESPIESAAVETIAAVYSDEMASTLTADVPAAGGTFDWNVKTMPRPK